MTAILALFVLLSCKTKKSEPEKSFIPVVSIIRNQVDAVDTSLYSIRRMDIRDSLHTDTIFIHREDFRKQAKDFLELPDITEKETRDNFKEETRFDDMLNSAIVTYLPINASKSVIQREDIVMNQAGDKVKNIIIDYLLSNRDSIVQKRMLWTIDRSFQVTTMKQLAGQAETINTVKVVWNEPENQ